MYMLSIGSYKSYGILYTEMKDYFGTGSGATAWVGSVCYMLLLGLGPLTNWLAVKYTFRTVGVVGGLLTCSGYALCMVISKLEYMYLTFGVIVGKRYRGRYSPTILKNILCLFLQDLVNLNVTQILIG